MPINLQRPITAADAFMEGATGTQNILANILQGRQRQQELDETAKYHEGDLGIRRGQLDINRGQLGINQGHLDIARLAEGRAQTQMKYLVPQWELANKTQMSAYQKKHMFDQIQMQHYQEILDEMKRNGGAIQSPQGAVPAAGGAAPAPADVNQIQPMDVANQPGQAPIGEMTPIAPQMPSIVPPAQPGMTMINQALQGQPMQPPPAKTPWQIRQETAGMTPQQTMQYVNQNSDLMRNAGQPPVAASIPQPQDVAPQAQLAEDRAKQSGKSQQTGIAFDGGRIVAPANKGQEWKDRLAAISAGDPDSPFQMAKPDEIKGDYPNQYLYRYWPSGLVTAHKTPTDMSGGGASNTLVKNETGEQRSQREAKTAMTVEDHKEANKVINEVADTVVTPAQRIVKLKKLLEDHPNLTGYLQGTKAALNASDDKALAEFIGEAGLVQADAEKLVSQRGSNLALKWAKTIKPTSFKRGEFNKGLLDGLLSDYQSAYEKDNSKYKIFAHEDLPDDLAFPGQEIEYPPMKDLQDTVDETGMTIDEVKKKWKEKVLASRKK